MSEERSSAAKQSLQKVENLDIGALVIGTVTGVVKKRPVGVSIWLLGLLLAAAAKGFAVDDQTRESYQITLQQAEEVDNNELAKALRAYQRADEQHYNSKGWFWACNMKCQQNLDKANMAKQDVARVQKKRDGIMTEARKEVGIWSVYGVQDVRNAFWSAWKSGKDFAARYTMMDAMFMAFRSSREESMAQMAMKLVMQYIINLTMGLIGAFFYFIYNVYYLVISYGESALSGLAFFLLVLVAGMSTVGTYLFAIYGTVAGGGLYLVKQAAKQAALEQERYPNGRPRSVQQGGRPGPGGYGGGYGGRPGYGRPHGE